MNDHCPIPNFFAYKETTLAYAKHSLSLLLPSQEMSLNIDINKILPVKVSGSSPNLLSDFTAELQRIKSWEDVPLEFSRLSTDAIKVSVALRSCDPFYPFLPSFVRFRILMDLPKTQYRIRKDVDLRALKIDDSFITN